MKYFSLNHKAPEATFKQAVINGIAPDKGLYFPVNRKALDKGFFDEIEKRIEAEPAVAAEWKRHQIEMEALKEFHYLPDDHE